MNETYLTSLFIVMPHITVNRFLGFIFSFLGMVKKELFFDLSFEIKILMDWHILRFPESENQVLSGWPLSFCVCVRVCCYQHNSKTNYSRSSEFGILHLNHILMLQEHFVCRSTQKKKLQYITFRRRHFLLMHSNKFRLL